jgi:hypothetical protein
MNNNSHLLEELEAICPLLATIHAYQKKTYQVPERYFEQLPDTISIRLKLSTASEEQPADNTPAILQQLNSSMPFSTPGNYFTDLPQTVMAGIKAVEFVNTALENLPPLLVGLKDKPLYQVPPTYFDTLADVITSKTQQKKTILTALSFRKIGVRYAAASVIGIIVIGGLIYRSLSISTTHTTGVANANVPSTQLQHEIKNISDTELMHLSNEISFVLPAADSIEDTRTTNVNTAQEAATDLLSNVPDDELQQYLEQQPGINPIN